MKRKYSSPLPKAESETKADAECVGRRFNTAFSGKSPLTQRHVDELKARGFTVVEGIVGNKFCEETKRQWLACMQSYESGFKADDPSTWNTDTLPINTRGMQDWPPVAQESYVWNTRLKAAPVFSELWGCKEEDLISSMDRVCFVPSNRLKITKRTEKGWLHLDQSSQNRRGPLHCVQGFITLNNIGAGEVSLEVLAGAHRHHKAFFEHLAATDKTRDEGSEKADWLKFSDDDLVWYEKQDGVERVRVHAPAGSIVLWDSRLPHHAVPPRDSAQRSSVDRYVIYVCMVPRAWASPATLLKRICAFEKGRATPHWPHDSRMFPLKPRTYGKELICKDFDVTQQVNKTRQAVDDPTLFRRLIGYDK